MTSPISSLIAAVEQGDGAACETLFATLYSELHRIAKRELARHGFGVSMSPTTLLHQAYLDMAERDGRSFPDEARFIGYAARVMRGLIIDHARNRGARKRGGGFELTTLATDAEQAAINSDELVKIGEALDELTRADPSLAEVVDLKFFCGFTFAEIATMKGLSERTVQRKWDKARIYLHRSLQAELES